MVNNPLSTEIVSWHLDNGGFCHIPEVYKYHTLRLLHEATELCLASGATQQDIFEVGEIETNKHAEKNLPGDIDLENMSEEIADIAILLDVFAYYTRISIDDAVHDKLQILHTRKWRADEFGVLWRDRTQETEESV